MNLAISHKEKNVSGLTLKYLKTCFVTMTGEAIMNNPIQNHPEQPIVLQKLNDANIPGFVVEVDPEEADLLGAFIEDALDEQDALDGRFDRLGDLTYYDAFIES